MGMLMWLPSANSIPRNRPGNSGKSSPMPTPRTMLTATQTLRYRSNTPMLFATGVTELLLCSAPSVSHLALRPHGPGDGEPREIEIHPAQFLHRDAPELPQHGRVRRGHGITRQPGPGGRHDLSYLRRVLEGVVHPAALLALRDQSRLLEVAQVLGHRRGREPQHRRDLADAQPTAAQHCDDPEPGRMAEGLVESGRVFQIRGVHGTNAYFGILRNIDMEGGTAPPSPSAAPPALK